MKEGWSINITKRQQRTHYYKNEVSLCGKAKQEKFMNNTTNDVAPSKYSFHCVSCIKKLNKTKKIKNQ